MHIRDMRALLGDTQSEFAARYQIPFRTVQNWEAGTRKPPAYVLMLLENRIREDLINHKTIVMPAYDPKKPNLPNRGDYIGGRSWLKAVRDCFNEEVVFALDDALICQGNFGGHNDESIVWIYGDNDATRYNGVVVLGNHINSRCVKEENGLKYTDFNRTIFDALVNESIIDMQGITEALSKYYYTNNESLDGIFVVPEYQERFEMLVDDAMNYYNS